MAPRRRACAGWSRDRLQGSREGLERARQTQCCSQIIHLAKLNPNCHMNYLDYYTCGVNRKYRVPVSMCLSVCLSVSTITQKINDLGS